MRANFGQQECRLDLTGSDILEDFSSKNGQWVGNHHDYNFSDLRRNSSHMIRLEQIQVDPLAPEFAKPHPKQESIWVRQYADGFVKALGDDGCNHDDDDHDGGGGRTGENRQGNGEGMTGFITRYNIQEISLEEAVPSVTSQTTIPTAVMMLTLQMA